MPNIMSAAKRLRQDKVRNLRNRGVRTALRSQIKKVRTAIADGNVELSQTEFRLAVKKLDQAAVVNTIHPNAAARTKSRLNSQIKALGSK